MTRPFLLTTTLILAASAAAQTPRAADQALRRLLEGNQRFAAHHARHPDQTPARLSELERGQHPFATVLTCSDSRVPPEVIFDQGLGDLFVIRVAGNIADDLIAGSIEYAAEHLHVPLVMVLGHDQCGAVQAAVAGGHPGGHLPAIVTRIQPAVDEARAQAGDLVGNCVRINVQHVVRQLRSSEPVLKELVDSGQLKVVGARYNLHTGHIIPLTE